MTTPPPPPGQPGDTPYGQQPPGEPGATPYGQQPPGEGQQFPSYGQAQPVADNPYAIPGGPGDPGAKSNKPVWFWVVGIIVAIVLLCCCGGVALVGWGAYQAEQLESSPVIPTESSSDPFDPSSSSTSASSSPSSSTSSSTSTAAPTSPDVPAPPAGSVPNTDTSHTLPTADLEAHIERGMAGMSSDVFCPAPITLVKGETATCTATVPDGSKRSDVDVEVEWAVLTDTQLEFYLNFNQQY